MGEMTLSKSRNEGPGAPAPAPDPEDDERVTTVKCRKRLATFIRQIGALTGLNQEDVLELFAEQIEERRNAEAAKVLPPRRRQAPPN